MYDNRYMIIVFQRTKYYQMVQILNKSECDFIKEWSDEDEKEVAIFFEDLNQAKEYLVPFVDDVEKIRVVYF